MDKNTHQVQKVLVDFHHHTRQAKAGLPEEIDQFCSHRLVDVLEKKLDEVIPPAKYVWIDRLVISIDLRYDQFWEERLSEYIGEQLAKELAGIKDHDRPASGHTGSVSSPAGISGKLFEAWKGFLFTGRLPWWFERSTWAAFEDTVLEALSVNDSRRAMQILEQNREIRERFVFSFTDEFKSILAGRAGIRFDVIKSWCLVKEFFSAQKWSTPSHAVERWYWEVIWQAAPWRFREKEMQHEQMNAVMGRKELIAAYLDKPVLAASGEPLKSIRSMANAIWPTESSLEQPSEKFHLDERQPDADTLEGLSADDHSMGSFGPRLAESQHKDELPADVYTGLQHASAPEPEADSADVYLSSGEDTEDRRPSTLRQPEPAIDQPAEVYVDYAGIVILHPFLEYFFDACNLLSNGRWKSTASQVKAVELLSYLVSGSLFFPEYRMTLFKEIAGLPRDTFVNPSLNIDNNTTNEADAMLEAVLGHWKALKGSSIQALRENFLDRRGKLQQLEHGWELYVERRSVDILLEKLPWGLSPIKWPWKEGLLIVHWT